MKKPRARVKDKELFAQFSKEFAELDKDVQPVLLTMTKVQAWALMSQLQLALRHPENTGRTSTMAREIAETIERNVATTPALKEVARRGWHQEYDLT